MRHHQSTVRQILRFLCGAMLLAQMATITQAWAFRPSSEWILREVMRKWHNHPQHRQAYQNAWQKGLQTVSGNQNLSAENLPMDGDFMSALFVCAGNKYLNPATRCITRHLQKQGVDLSQVYFARHQDRITYLIGCDPRQNNEKRNCLWIDTEHKVPLQVSKTTSAGKQTTMGYQNWQPQNTDAKGTKGMWLPKQVKWQEGDKTVHAIPLR